jgi:hypothetical protein
MSSPEEAIAAWTTYFESNPGAARSAREKLSNGGQLGREEQLGLSTALTPRGFRCSHHGDVRHCPYCAGDRARAKREERRQAREDREDREKMEGLERRLAGSLESLDRQSKALDKAYRYIAALENELKRDRKRRRWTRRK